MPKQHSLTELLNDMKKAERALREAEKAYKKERQTGEKATMHRLERVAVGIYTNGSDTDIVNMERLLVAVEKSYDGKNMTFLGGAASYIERGLNFQKQRKQERENSGVFRVGKEASEFLKGLDKEAGQETISLGGYHQRIWYSIRSGKVKVRHISQRHVEITEAQLKRIHAMYCQEG